MKAVALCRGVGGLEMRVEWEGEDFTKPGATHVEAEHRTLVEEFDEFVKSGSGSDFSPFLGGFAGYDRRIGAHVFAALGSMKARGILSSVECAGLPEAPAYPGGVDGRNEIATFEAEHVPTWRQTVTEADLENAGAA